MASEGVQVLNQLVQSRGSDCLELFAGHAISTAASGVIAHPELLADKGDGRLETAEAHQPDFARLNI